MTLREKYDALMADLVAEKALYPSFDYLYDKKIAALKAAMEERYGTRERSDTGVVADAGRGEVGLDGSESIGGSGDIS